MTVKVAEEMADQIIAAFPSEVKDYYFMRDGPKAPKGKLYAKYHNVIRSLKSGGLIEKTKNTVKPMNSESETNIDHYLNSLKHDNCTFNEIEVIWAATVNTRLNSIRKSKSTSETLLSWPSYKLPAGYRLVDIDFLTVQPNASSLMTVYPNYISKLIKLFKFKIKDSQSTKLVEDLNEENVLTENSRDCYVFYLLHALFVPTSKKTTRDDKGRK
ncbi:unnamed protein product [Macrosiphum euphorbiae]|uniref:Uncharacterized protein n=1 Tax=Macrosiphum euphorbiae TaxID=13131 RepID=A0AAV0WLP7_9HEMI|nr:unnamed protein product [Macrosiphum euphorbiae]